VIDASNVFLVKSSYIDLSGKFNSFSHLSVGCQRHLKKVGIVMCHRRSKFSLGNSSLEGYLPTTIYLDGSVILEGVNSNCV